MIRRVLLFAFLLMHFLVNQLQAQNLSGSWEGLMSNDELLQVNIVKDGNHLCGYTYDYDINNVTGHCKAYFKGWFDPGEKKWILTGTSFIENSGGHILMLLKLWHQPGDPINILRSTVESKSEAFSLFNMGGDRDAVRLKKTSTSPVKLSNGKPICLPEIKKPIIPFSTKKASVKTLPQKPIERITKTPVKPLPVKKVATKKIIQKKIGISRQQHFDTLKRNPIVSKPTASIITYPELDKRVSARKKNAISHIIVDEKNITLNVYDNGVVDNDTVSIFYNGKLIAGKQLLSEKPLVIHLVLDENAPLHEIVMFAENLGTIAPNTALVVVTVGKKRYELHSSSSLTENAVLIFEYKPEIK